MKFQLVRHITAATIGMASLTAQAGLTTLSGDVWPPAGSSGLEAVQFKVGNGGGLQVALGAHAYKESATMPNNGADTFYADKGLSPNPNTELSRWSLDYSINYGAGTVADYLTRFLIDVDPTDATSFMTVNIDASNCAAICGLNVLADSNNASVVFQQLFAQGSGFAFDPFAAGQYAFSLQVFRPNRRIALASTAINVNTVPEPGSLALVGAALFGALLVRRRA